METYYIFHFNIILGSLFSDNVVFYVRDYYICDNFTEMGANGLSWYFVNQVTNCYKTRRYFWTENNLRATRLRPACGNFLLSCKSCIYKFQLSLLSLHLQSSHCDRLLVEVTNKNVVFCIVQATRTPLFNPCLLLNVVVNCGNDCLHANSVHLYCERRAAKRQLGYWRIASLVGFAGLTIWREATQVPATCAQQYCDWYIHTQFHNRCTDFHDNPPITFIG